MLTTSLLALVDVFYFKKNGRFVPVRVNFFLAFEKKFSQKVFHFPLYGRCQLFWFYFCFFGTSLDCSNCTNYKTYKNSVPKRIFQKKNCALKINLSLARKVYSLGCFRYRSGSVGFFAVFFLEELGLLFFVMFL